MAINMIECGSCGEVIDGANRVCPHCGAQLQRATGAAQSTSFVDRYRGTPYDVSQEIAPFVPPRRSSSTLLVGLGVALIVVVAALGAMYALQPPAPAPTNAIVLPPKPTPTIAPTLPPQVTMAMNQLQDPEFSAHVKVESRASWAAEVAGAGLSVIVNLDATVSGGDASGRVTVGKQLGYEFKQVKGQYYQRLLPNGKWAATSTMISQARILPLFDLTAAKQLQLVGNETLGGKAVYHLRTTEWWNPDVPRIALMDSLQGVTPQTVVLDLYVDIGGAPVRADYVVSTKAIDGRALMTINTRYDFSDVGKAVEILAPGQTPRPSPRPSASGSASASASMK